MQRQTCADDPYTLRKWSFAGGARDGRRSLSAGVATHENDHISTNTHPICIRIAALDAPLLYLHAKHLFSPRLYPDPENKCLQRDRKTVSGCLTKALCLLAQSKAKKVNLSMSRVCLQISRSLGCLFLSLSRKRTVQDKGCGGTHPGGLKSNENAVAGPSARASSSRVWKLEGGAFVGRSRHSSPTRVLQEEGIS